MQHVTENNGVLTMTLPRRSSSWIEWLYAGVDCSLPSNCGDACVYYIPTLQKIFETAIVLPLCFLEMQYGWRKIQERLPQRPIPEAVTRARDPTIKVLLLVSLCLVFGMEMGYKLASNQMIWVLNPCHLITIVEIYLLAAAPSRTVMIVFRCLCQALNGPTMALLFPVVHTRLLPFEVSTYYIQHTLIILVPIYLLQTGVYTYEPWNDWSYAFFMTGLMFFYHWVPLQGLAMLSGINLNNMVCPATSDPFSGRYYRIAAILHQTVCCLVFGRLVRALVSLAIPISDVKTSHPATTTSALPNQQRRQVGIELRPIASELKKNGLDAAVDAPIPNGVVPTLNVLPDLDGDVAAVPPPVFHRKKVS